MDMHALDPFQGGTVRADIPFDYCTAGNEKLRDTDVCASNVCASMLYTNMLYTCASTR